MDVELIAVVLIVVAAAGYFGIVLVRRTRQFRPGTECGEDCGCSAPQKKQS